MPGPKDKRQPFSDLQQNANVVQPGAADLPDQYQYSDKPVISNLPPGGGKENNNEPPPPQYSSEQQQPMLQPSSSASRLLPQQNSASQLLPPQQMMQQQQLQQQQIITQQPMAQPPIMMVAPPPQQIPRQPMFGDQPKQVTNVQINSQKVEKRDWATPKWNICDKVGVCCAVLWCPLCTAMMIARGVNECMCTPCVPGGMIALRTKQRTMFKIKGSIWKDWCALWCCTLCTLCQMKREVDICEKARLHKHIGQQLDVI